MSVGFSVGNIVLVGDDPTYSLRGNGIGRKGVEELAGATGRVISLVDRDGDIIVEFVNEGCTEALRGSCLTVLNHSSDSVNVGDKFLTTDWWSDSSGVEIEITSVDQYGMAHYRSSAPLFRGGENHGYDPVEVVLDTAYFTPVVVVI